MHLGAASGGRAKAVARCSRFTQRRARSGSDGGDRAKVRRDSRRTDGFAGCRRRTSIYSTPRRRWNTTSRSSLTISRTIKTCLACDSSIGLFPDAGMSRIQTPAAPPAAAGPGRRRRRSPRSRGDRDYDPGVLSFLKYHFRILNGMKQVPCFARAAYREGRIARIRSDRIG